jgi:phosphopantothenoylcysteine decarboxylase/phosphopantothenate--cysteine ligase
MAYAIAEEFAQNGAQVELISGPVHIQPRHAHIRLHKVRSAQEMLAQSISLFPSSDIAVMAAAVADFTPLHPFQEKIKRTTGDLQLNLVPTQDIAATLGKTKKAAQFLVGFALETEQETANAQRKLCEKNLDMIVLNSLNDAGAGFDTDTNKITIIEKNGAATPYDLKTKAAVARDIVDKIMSIVNIVNTEIC